MYLPTPGDRLFFKRRALAVLRSYWCRRWDALALRRELSRSDRPRYFADQIAFDGLYVRLRRLPWLWYAGVFSRGRHLPATDDARHRWYQDPIHLPLWGLGPRALVFPPGIFAHLDALPLVGSPYRYALGLDEPHRAQAIHQRTLRQPGARVCLQVERFSVGRAPPLLTWQGPRHTHRPTLRVEGTIARGPLRELPLIVPIGEVYWRGLQEPAP